MTGIAALPMYDWPALRGRTDQLWQGLREELDARGIDAPKALTRGRPAVAIWGDPDLLLGQTCGYPYAKHLRARVALVATPRYSAHGCAGANYSSAIVARADAGIASLGDLRQACAAVNHADSFSGHWALRAALARDSLDNAVAGVRITGSHRASLMAVAEGRADLAAIDCVAWAIAGRHLPDVTARLTVIGRTDPAPGLPLITSKGRSDGEVAALREALEAVASRADLAQVRADLMIDGYEALEEATYDRILEVEAAALAHPAWPLTAEPAGA